jgi:hypothetical protein
MTLYVRFLYPRLREMSKNGGAPLVGCSQLVIKYIHLYLPCVSMESVSSSRNIRICDHHHHHQWLHGPGKDLGRRTPEVS